ncbi:MAG: MFS transporter [Verrucomicrobia bacterium]|nr:MFS transporter [Verrucomicrobiota bacterium]
MSGTTKIDRHAEYNKPKLFLLSVIALATAGIGFSIRGDIGGALQSHFFDPVDKLHSAEMTASVLGIVFMGFAVAIAVGSPLLDYFGMGRMLGLSSFLFIVGNLVAIFADHINIGLPIFWVVWLGMLLVGVGQGLVETVINPLAATLYPDDKTHKLNVLHAWWPGGIIIGGLISLGLGYLGAGWQIKLAVVLLPAVAYGAMTLGAKFPPTERVAAGVSASQMFKELARPLFIILWLSMFLTAASELAPGQWVDIALTRTVGMKGIILLVYVSGLMFVMRHFAGTFAHKLSPIGLLWVSCFLASAGLLLLSVANSPITGLLAATVWGVGVCYMWPTMLASASERFPRGGALLLGLMGTAGTMSIKFVLPWMGSIFDKTKIQVAGGEEAFKALSGDKLNEVLGAAAQQSFRSVAILPAILLVVFGAIWLYDRSRGGYKAEQIVPSDVGVAPVSK